MHFEIQNCLHVGFMMSFHISFQEKGTSSPLHPGIGGGGIDKDHSSLGGLVDGIGSIGGAGDFSLAGECFHILNTFTA